MINQEGEIDNMKSMLGIVTLTLLTRILLFPFSLMAQKNTIKMVKIRPQVEDIKARAGDDYRILSKELRILYKQEKYNEFKTLLPLIVQIPVLIVIFRLVRDMEINFEISKLNIAGISSISSFLMCFTQNKLNPLVNAQSFWGKWGVTIFLIIFSGYFAYASPLGVGVYWVCSNIFAIGIAFICNAIYNPKKYIDYDTRILYKKTKEDKYIKKLRNTREKEDVKRFFSVEKELVFYSEKSGFYKYFDYYIDYILESTDIVVHYITSDYNDQVFKISHPNLKTYYCGLSALITLFMKMDAEIVFMTMPDLEQYQYKRSLVKKNIEYIYAHHGFGSINMMIRKGALDHFDTVFCYGKTFNEEIRAMEKIYKTKEKKLFDVGFGLFDNMIKSYEPVVNEKTKILIAPSWHKDNLLETCLDEIMESLLNNDYDIIIRPHPEFIKRFPVKMNVLKGKYENIVQTDFSDNSAVLQSDILITDWSTIAMEFSFVTKKPCVFINTPMKVMNPEYYKIPVEPLDISLRNKIGISMNIEKLDTMNSVIKDLLAKDYKEIISKIMSEYLYNTTDAGKKGAKYIINQVYSRRDEKNRRQF